MPSGRRIACLLIKDLPLAAYRRAAPELREAAFAISLGAGMRAPLGFVAPAAARLGIVTGMTVAQGRAVLPDLIVVPRAPALEQAAAAALLDVAASFSPLIEVAEPGKLFLDLAGLNALYGPDQLLALELVRRARAVGIAPAVGIAASKSVAALAAACGPIRVIDPGREAEFLNWLPLELVTNPELEARLERLGIRRLGDLARLDAAELGGRMGPEALSLLHLLRGDRNGAVLVCTPAAEEFIEGMDLEYGLESLGPLSFILRALLERLSARLRIRGLSVGALNLSLALTDHRHDERHIALAAPTHEVRPLLALLLLELEKQPPLAGVEKITLSAQPSLPRPAQSDLFLPPTPAPERLQTTLARLVTLCGPDRVGTLLPANSYRPEALERHPFAPPPPRPQPSAPAAEFNCMVIRALRPAHAVEVLCARGLPEFVRGEGISARVVAMAGPWRRQGEWWDRPATGGFARDYYEMALSDGAIYRLYHDLATSRWFMDGIYD
ncbi:MAG TPA: DNA polymerase Y family protein [Candidatus Binataceae bacterium]|nr:DNA polymerase Y family protein [Candidatus Binataceae bacterium]